ncbi:MAG: Gldg family protein [Candidatus Cryptobacteroides sp.]
MASHNNFNQTLRIAKAELKMMFYSPVAWLVLLVFAVQVGYSFVDVFSGILDSMDLGRSAWSVSQQIFGKSMSSILPGIQRYIYLYIPLVTMGLMSREYASGSIKLLYSSPVRNSSIILGKFLSMVVYGGALIGIIAMFSVFTHIFTPNYDYKMVCVALLGLYLLILAYSAIGIFFSSLTKYQVVAAIGTLAALAFLNNVDEIGQKSDFIRDITYWLGLSGRAKVFLDGLFTSEDFLYFVIVITLFLSLSIFKLNTEKSIMSRRTKILKYCGIVAACLGCGYLTTLPRLKYYYDATYTQNNTLCKESRQILADIDGRLTITTYVNLFDDQFYWFLPQARNYDKERLEKYIRFKPDTRLEYVYYYAPNGNQELEAKYPDMTWEERAEEICKVHDLKLKNFLTKEEIDRIIDLEPEKYRWVRVVEDQHGHKEVMRMYNDNQKLPNEEQMSVVFNKLVNRSPMVAFAQGYGARAIDNYGSRGYYLVGYDKWFRHSLYNLGFDVKTLDLDNAADFEGTDVLVLTDINKPLSGTALANIRSYIDRGGDMFILSDYRRGEYLAPVVEELGIRYEGGLLVQENEYIAPTNVAADFTEEASEFSPIIRDIAPWGYCVLMPTSLAIDYSGVKDFNVTSLLETSDKAWIEYETTDFVDGEFVCNEAAGEKTGVYSTFVALDRQIGGKTQRIAISGDADFIANEELGAEHSGISASNYTMVQAAFRWFSGDKFPIVIDRIDAIDGEVNLPLGFSMWLKIIFMGIFPLSLMATGIVLIMRRQRK